MTNRDILQRLLLKRLLTTCILLFSKKQETPATATRWAAEVDQEWDKIRWMDHEQASGITLQIAVTFLRAVTATLIHSSRSALRKKKKLVSTPNKLKKRLGLNASGNGSIDKHLSRVEAIGIVTQCSCIIFSGYCLFVWPRVFDVGSVLLNRAESTCSSICVSPWSSVWEYWTIVTADRTRLVLHIESINGTKWWQLGKWKRKKSDSSLILSGSRAIFYQLKQSMEPNPW